MVDLVCIINEYIDPKWTEWTTLNFFDRSENMQIKNFMKIRPVGADMLHADKQTDRKTDKHDEANSHCWQFCEGS